jgi:hypothetical protein
MIAGGARGASGGKVRNLPLTDEETPAHQASILNLGDPKVEPQLVRRLLRPLEAALGAWSAKQFSLSA